ncbi:MAG TPA: CHAT domain-containing tetratricopeptide repeat protein [Agriterribacter sp.]|nr:CHAT domain-containing tetratricopeptide repeat protein [Agriterribacter sp.]
MSQKVHILIFAMLFSSAVLNAQCPNNDTLCKRIAFFASSSTIPANEKLKELLAWEKQAATCSTLPDTTRASLLNRIGSVFFARGDYMLAIQYLQKSIKITATLAQTSSAQSRVLIKKYFDLARIYDSLQHAGKRLVALDSCAAISARINAVDVYYLFALYARVQYYFDIGDYNQCISYAGFCGKLGQQYTERNPGDQYDTGTWYTFSSLGWIVNSFLRMGDYDSAEKLLANKVEECKKSGLNNYLGTVYGQLAEVKENQGNYVEALTLYKQALSWEAGWGSSYNCRVILNNMGVLYGKRFNNTGQSLVYYKKALWYDDTKANRNRLDTLEMLNTASNIGYLFAQQNEFDSAFSYFQRSFDCIKTGIAEDDILHISLEEFARQKKMNYLTDLLINKGSAYLQQYKATGQKQVIESAVRLFKIADKLFDHMRNEQTDTGSKLFWRKDARRLYEPAIEACYLLGNTTTAFYFFEKSRAVLLSDQLSQQRWMGENDILNQTQLIKKINRLEKGLNAGIRSASNNTITPEIFALKQELDHWEQQIKTRNPLYYQSFVDTGFITLQYVQQTLLKKNEVILEIFSGSKAVYALLATTTQKYLTKINKQDFEQCTQLYISYLSNAGLMNRKFDDFVNTSHHLFNLIFKDIPLTGNRIIISPDGQYFPFESLITSNENKPVTYFIAGHAVSYTYSARFIMNDFINEPTTGGRDFMGIAPVNYPSSFSLAALRGSDQSLYKIAGYFNNAVNRVTSHASRNNFLQQFSQYQIIQLYSHASDSSSNNEPVIYFADSALYLSELVNEYKPLTQLVVLSACETGKGKNYQGEGVFSFNRGFAALGIPAAVANLWSVDNTSTYRLTELFYKWLTKGLPTDIALQKAKLEFLETASKEKSMPYYWAGPVLIGKADVINMHTSYSWKWIIAFAGAGFVLFGAVRIWGFPKNKT